MLRTRYAQELELDWDEVTSLSSDAPLSVMRRGAGQPERALLRADSPGQVRLVGEGAPRVLPLQEIAYLNPRPYESGIGTGYSGRAALLAAYTRGNTESDRLNADAELTARARPYRYAFSGKIDRRAEAGLGTSVTWRGTANYDRFVEERRFVYVRGSIEHDTPKDIDRRTSAGLGYGVELFDSEPASLSLRAGVDYVVVERLVAADERYPAFGWGVKAAYNPWGPRLRLFHEQDGFWDLRDTARVSLRSKSGASMPLFSGLSVRVQLNVDWERRPAPGRKATDTTLLLGLDYAW